MKDSITPVLIAWALAACSGAEPDDDDAAIDAPPIDAERPIDADGRAGTELEAGLRDPIRLAVGADHVYVIEHGDPGTANGAVARVPRAGGAYAVLAQGQSHPVDLQLADRVYWTNSDFLVADGSSVRAMPLAGGASVELASTNPGPGQLAVNGDTAFFSVAGADLRLFAVPVAGGPAAPVATAASAVIDLDADAAALYFLVSGGLFRVARGGGAAVELTRNAEGASGFAADAGALYWTAASTLMRIGKDGTGERAVAELAGPASAIAVDGDHILVGGRAAAGGYIVRVAIAGGAAQTVVVSGREPAAIAADGEAFYWVERGVASGTGALYRIAR